MFEFFYHDIFCLISFTKLSKSKNCLYPKKTVLTTFLDLLASLALAVLLLFSMRQHQIYLLIITSSSLSSLVSDLPALFTKYSSIMDSWIRLCQINKFLIVWCSPLNLADYLLRWFSDSWSGLWSWDVDSRSAGEPSLKFGSILDLGSLFLDAIAENKIKEQEMPFYHYLSLVTQEET